ncbi:IS3 family transposase, partial [Streptococcus agalactiae]|uniref:IS3 family transposase n=2 Tax=Streptococcus agalactiae TaxID=1311 RepID=UPI001F61F772
VSCSYYLLSIISLCEGDTFLRLTAHDLEQAITDYIFYYNNKRIKAKLKGLSPVQYRTKSFT